MASLLPRLAAHLRGECVRSTSVHERRRTLSWRTHNFLRPICVRPQPFAEARLCVSSLTHTTNNNISNEPPVSASRARRRRALLDARRHERRRRRRRDDALVCVGGVTHNHNDV